MCPKSVLAVNEAMPPSGNRLVDEQVRRNLAARDRWQSYAAHREEVTQRLLGGESSNQGRLCVLGAGNCNDLDLARLTAAFQEVHLVDVDCEALADGIARQTDAAVAVVRQHGGVDLLGALSDMAEWSVKRPPAEAELAACLTRASEPPVDLLPGPFDVVASVCLLSQLIESAVVSLGEGHRRFAEVVLAIRAAHLRLLARLLSPGGRAVLISDFVSSQTAAGLKVADPEWPLFLKQTAAQRNFFHAVHPFAVMAHMQNDPLLKQTISAARPTGCWRWDQGARVYAVAAFEFSAPA
jgi:hypothetical protein